MSIFVVIGEVGNSADSVSILHLGPEQQSEFFLCYAPKISPSGRFIVFRKFYPRFTDAPGQTDVLIIYDIHGHNQKLLESGNSIAADGDSIGTVVYPEQNAKNQSLQSWIDDPLLRHAVDSSAGYLWVDEMRFAFVDYLGERPWLVDINIKDINHPVIMKSEFRSPRKSPVSGLEAVPGAVKILFGSAGEIIQPIAG